MLRLTQLICCSLLAWECVYAQDANSGKALFRSNCAFCHGVTGLGGRGPSLVTARVAQSTTDAELKRVISGGIPGTSMPAFDSITGDDLEKLVGHIRSLASAGVNNAAVVGDAQHGAEIYVQNGCAGCHRIGDAGSDFGPALTRIGGARSSEYIRQSILEPSADVPPEYQGVTVVTAAGKKIDGARINEDTFSIQLRLPSGQFAMYKKTDLKSVTDDAKSLMPGYTKLPAKDLQDLLAYLDTLRGKSGATADAEKAKGIH